VKAQLFVAGVIFVGGLVPSSISYAAPHMPICETRIHPSYCKRVGQRHERHSVKGTSFRVRSHGGRFHTSHQTESYYDDNRGMWGSDMAQSYEPPAAIYTPPISRGAYPPAPGPTFNFYGPTTNNFGPTGDYGAGYGPPWGPAPDEGARMDPWHGYNSNNGLENGY
jgi:hypothetical protein